MMRIPSGWTSRTSHGNETTLRHPRYNAEQQHDEHRDGKDDSDCGEAQDDPYSTQSGLLEAYGFLLVPQGFAISLRVLALEVANLFQKLDDPFVRHRAS